MLRRSLRAILVGSVILCSPLAAQRQSAWSLSVDNDFFAYWRSEQSRSDRDYSSGIELSLARPLASPGRWTRTLVLALTHQLFTPDIRQPRPVPFDRPFAAILSGGAMLDLERPTQRHSVGLTLSVTGAPALGDDLQELIHAVLGSPPPVGWDHQLPFEIGLSAVYRGDRRLFEAAPNDGLGLRTAAHWGAELGTIRSAATLGLGLVAGWRPPTVWRPLAPDAAERDGIRVFIPLGAGLDVVGQSIVLDGGIMARTTALDRKTLVPYGEFGLGVEIGSVAISWIGHVTGREFATQPGAHSYGTFRVTLR